MKTEVSCLNTRAILDYLHRRSIDPKLFINGLTPELDAHGDPLAYLSDRNNWVPTGAVSLLPIRRSTVSGRCGRFFKEASICRSLTRRRSRCLLSP